MSSTETDFDALWNYSDAAGTEAKFRARLAQGGLSASHELQLLTQIARTQGLQRKFAEAHAALDQVESRLDEQGDPIVRTRYLLERGRLFNSSGQPQDAFPLFAAATNIAMAGQLDFHAVDALHMLAIAENDPAKQFDWNFKAMKLAESSTDARARSWLGSLYNNIGWTYFDQKRFDEALVVFRKALAFRESAGKEEPIRIARWCVGKTLRALGRLDDALHIQRGLLEEAQQHNQPAGFVHEELAECLFIRGESDAARPHFQKAFAALSMDEWLKAREPARLERLKSLGGLS